MKLHLDLACAKLSDTRKELETRVFVWKINGLSEMFGAAKTNNKKYTESPPFYTDSRTENCGYKLKIKIYPNGEQRGKDTHVTVYVVVMKGEYDAILSWPFKKKVTFTLIDQQEDPDKRENITRCFTSENMTGSFSRPVKEENPGRGFCNFISHEKLYTRRYVVDDTLFLRVEIGPVSG